MPIRRLHARRLAPAVAALALAAACRDLPFQPEDPAATTYAPRLGITLSAFTRLPSGVYVQDVVTGSGTLVTDSSTVTVGYRGFLTDGRSFDSTATQQTRAFDLRATIPGWRQGLPGARAGGRRRLVIPASQAYGNRTTNGIPAGSVLVFEIDIAGVTTPVSPPATSRVP